MYPFINHNQNDVISKMFWKNLHTLFYTLAAYAEYRQAKKEMQDFVTAKHNVDAFLGAKEKEQEQKKQREVR